jgi:CheY-like chemotaxis protein
MSKKAIVVDNDFFFVEFLTELLKQRGYEVLKAYDGKEGLTRLEQAGGAVDCIFVDMVMPKIDGEQFIRYTRRRFPQAHFPIVAVAGNIIEQPDRMDRIGADYYIPKGTMDDMEDSLNEFFDRIEGGESFPKDGTTLLGSGKTYPRQITLELMEMVRSLKGILESIGIGIVVLDQDQEVISVNGRALRMLKRPLDMVLNQPIEQVFPAEGQDTLRSEMRHLEENRGLEQTAFSIPLGTTEARVILTIYLVDEETAGWILAIKD